MSSGTPPHGWLVPDWPAPAGVRAVCTTRAGGTSLPPYDSLNLGTHVGDQPERVQRNRAVLQQSLQGARAVFLDQVHGTGLQELGPATPDGATADIAWTALAGLACTVMVADCLPVLWTDRAGTQVAASHAGWRGLLGARGQGVLEVTHRRMQEHAHGHPPGGPMMAWLGPCIGPSAFEVGPEVRQAFVDTCAQDARFFVEGAPGKWLADLPGLARRRLEALGNVVVYGNDGSAAWCTVSQTSRFFSHRRDRVSGRLAACIWRTG